MRRSLLLTSLALTGASGTPAALAGDRPPRVLVSVASSLKAALQEAALAHQASTGTEIVINAGASGSLLAQIEHGAPVDLFVSASALEIDRLAKGDRIDAATRRTLASNRLVVAVPRASRPLEAMGDLAGPGFMRIAVGSPRTVPAGRYAEQALARPGLWQALAARFVFAENVRQALDWVARGECDAAVVYRTDLGLGAGHVREGFAVPSDSHDPILYQAAVLASAGEGTRARAFLDFLCSGAGRKILAGHGFLPPPEP